MRGSTVSRRSPISCSQSNGSLTLSLIRLAEASGETEREREEERQRLGGAKRAQDKGEERAIYEGTRTSRLGSSLTGCY